MKDYYRVNIRARVPVDENDQALDQIRFPENTVVEHATINLVRAEDTTVAPNPDLDAAAAIGGYVPDEEKLDTSPCPGCGAEWGYQHAPSCFVMTTGGAGRVVEKPDA